MYLFSFSGCPLAYGIPWPPQLLQCHILKPHYAGLCVDWTCIPMLQKCCWLTVPQWEFHSHIYIYVEFIDLYICVYIYLFILGPHLWHMEVPRLGVKSEQWLPAYTTARATPHSSYIYDLHLTLQQRWILNPLREARDQTHILMDSSQVLNWLSHSGNSAVAYFKK